MKYKSTTYFNGEKLMSSNCENFSVDSFAEMAWYVGRVVTLAASDRIEFNPIVIKSGGFVGIYQTIHTPLA